MVQPSRNGLSEYVILIIEMGIYDSNSTVVCILVSSVEVSEIGVVACFYVRISVVNIKEGSWLVTRYEYRLTERNMFMYTSVCIVYFTVIMNYVCIVRISSPPCLLFGIVCIRPC